ncbi:MAG: DUF2111 domain-containing protein [Methanotrichaceae archaeon]|jgi:hypothetical protein|nr:DUF2111 domain-containing protein [Methanotrichaceae archaeon]
MLELILSENTKGQDLAPIAIAINEVIKLPITLRSLEKPGIRVENGKIIDFNYTGPILEDVLRTGKPIRTIPNSGAYKGVPVSVAPIILEEKVIAAIGVVDLVGTIDMPDVFSAYVDVVRQVSQQR